MNPQSAQDLINMGFYGYQGWSDNAAIQDYKATGGSGKGQLTNPQAVGGGQIQQGGNAVVGQANQYLSQTYNQVQQGLNDVKSRYSTLLNSIKGQTETAVANEFGKRGIPTSSGEVQKAQAAQVANNQGQVLAQQSQAELPFFQLLAGLSSDQTNNANSASGGIDWGNEFSNFVNNSGLGQQTTTSAYKPLPKLNQANKATVTPDAPIFNSTQNALFNLLAPVQKGIRSIGGYISNPLKTSNSLFSGIFNKA